MRDLPPPNSDVLKAKRREFRVPRQPPEFCEKYKRKLATHNAGKQNTPPLVYD